MKLSILCTSLEITRAVETSHTSDNAIKSPNDDILSAAENNATRYTHQYQYILRLQINRS